MRNGIQALQTEKYTDEAWIRRRVAVPDAFSTHKTKTPAGLLEIRATLAVVPRDRVLIATDCPAVLRSGALSTPLHLRAGAAAAARRDERAEHERGAADEPRGVRGGAGRGSRLTHGRELRSW